MPIQRWRCPVVLRVKSAIFAAIGVVVVVVFFPLWLAIPTAMLFAAWGLGVAALGASVTIDSDAAMVVLRMGLIIRRIPIANVTAVLVEGAKVSLARASGGEISLYAWRKSPLDGWLRVPAEAEEIGHAVASAVALASDPATAGTGCEPPDRSGSAARTRSALATSLLGCVGLIAIAAAFKVHISWQNPVMTALGALLALVLGVFGLFYVMFSLWLLLTRGGQRSARDRASAA